MNKCDECGAELEKTFVLTAFDIPFVCWVCPKSECFQLYKKSFENKYLHKEKQNATNKKKSRNQKEIHRKFR